MTTKPQIHQPRLSQPSLWRRRITYTSAQKYSFMQNKPNFPRFCAKNSPLQEKQTQNKPNQTQSFTLFILPILPVLSKAEGPIHPFFLLFSSKNILAAVLFHNSSFRFPQKSTKKVSRPVILAGRDTTKKTQTIYAQIN